ncbi:unnamed protein product, partial [marine sediment metagenome]
ERHYADLCEFDEEVDAVVAGEGAISPETGKIHNISPHR